MFLKAFLSCCQIIPSLNNKKSVSLPALLPTFLFQNLLEKLNTCHMYLSTFYFIVFYELPVSFFCGLSLRLVTPLCIIRILILLLFKLEIHIFFSWFLSCFWGLYSKLGREGRDVCNGTLSCLKFWLYPPFDNLCS